MNEVRLIGKKELMQKHPALRGRGRNSKWRIEWLIRTRQPVVRIGGRIYFDEAEIGRWIEKNKVKNGDNSK